MKNYEKDLFFMAKNGNIGAYEQLIETYERKVFSLLFTALGDRTQASEMTQDIFVRVYMDLKKEETEKRLSHLVYSTTRKLLLSACRSSKCSIAFQRLNTSLS